MPPRCCHGDSESRTRRRPRTRTRPGVGLRAVFVTRLLFCLRPGPAKVAQLSPVVNIDGNGAVASEAVAAQRRRGAGLSCVSLLRFQCRCTDIQGGRQGRRPMSSERERTGPSIRARGAVMRELLVQPGAPCSRQSLARVRRENSVALHMRRSRIPDDHVPSPRDGARAVPAQTWWRTGRRSSGRYGPGLGLPRRACLHARGRGLIRGHLNQAARP
jgi:hypothetical protein